jgi:hypothetical protein
MTDKIIVSAEYGWRAQYEAVGTMYPVIAWAITKVTPTTDDSAAEFVTIPITAGESFWNVEDIWVLVDPAGNYVNPRDGHQFADKAEAITWAAEQVKEQMRAIEKRRLAIVQSTT